MEQQLLDDGDFAFVGIDELVTYCIFLLSLNRREITFENVVAECFVNFPTRFALRGYPEWPDSSVISKSIWRARTDKGYVSGSVKEGFVITPDGLKAVEKIKAVLSTKYKNREVGKGLLEARTRVGKVLRTLQKSAHFQTFVQERNVNHMNEFDFADVLLCPPEASSESLKKNFEYFSGGAELYGNEEILEFLKLLAAKFHGLLERTGLD